MIEKEISFDQAKFKQYLLPIMAIVVIIIFSLTVFKIPPPASRISRYDLPASFIVNSFSLEPSKMICVWGSTNPGVTSLFVASILFLISSVEYLFLSSLKMDL